MSYHPFDKEVSIQAFDFQVYHAVAAKFINEHSQFSSIFPKYQQAFHDKATQSSDENERNLFLAIATVCSVRFETSGNGQYKPFCIIDGRRSFLPEDLSPTWQIVIREIANQSVDYPLLQSRFLDVAYLAADKKDFKLVKEVIVALCKTDVLTSDGYDCWWRMFSLLKTMGRGLSTELQNEQQRLFSIFQGLSVDNELHVVKLKELSHLVIEQGLLSTNERQTIAKTLKQAAEVQTNKSEFSFAEQLYSLLHDFYVRLGQDTEAYEMLRQRANAYLNSGIKRMNEEPSAYFVQMAFSEKALQVLRSIPNASRTQQDTQQIDGLIQQIPLLGQQASMHMQQIETPVDMSNVVTSATQFVQGLEVIEAIAAFIMLCPFSYSDLRESAICIIRENPLISMIQSSSMQGGRTVARSSSLDLNNAKDAEIAIWKKMVQDHHNTIAFYAHSQILPALRSLLSEHRISIEGLHYITEQSQFVPLDRRVSWAKGLMFGFDWNFSTALYCLVPQIEHMVRDTLKQRNLQTTIISIDGIENEIGLSALLENHLDACVNIFGEDVTYEMKMLFCDSWGANLRNTVAHGLLDDTASSSLFAVYAWWFTLKVCILGALPARRA